MASITAGELFGYRAPVAGETVRFPVKLVDGAGAPVTGILFDAAGMVVGTKKEGESAFTTFPTFATENWDEIGYGLYEVICRQSDAGELALFDTGGVFALYVTCTAATGGVNLYKINTADSLRAGDISDASVADAVFDELLSGHTGAGSLGALLDADTANSLVWRIKRLFHRFLTSAVITKDESGNGVLVIRDAAGGNVLRIIDLTQSGDVTTLEVQ